jgi:hypothetical protein
MANRMYPRPKWLNAHATAAWFRFQVAANPQLFRPRRAHILTLPTKARDASQREEYEEPRPRTEIAVMSVAGCGAAGTIARGAFRSRV